MKFLKPTWTEISEMCETLASKVKEYKPDILVGISRGGLVPVRLLSDILDNRNVAIMKIEFYTGIGERAKEPKVTQPLTIDITGKRVLIVDDVADTGHSLMVASEYVKSKGASECRIATLHFKPTSAFKPDYYLASTDAWIIYPWEIHEMERELKKKKKTE